MMTEFSIMGKSLCVELYFFFFYTTNTLESLPNMVTMSLINDSDIDSYQVRWHHVPSE